MYTLYEPKWRHNVVKENEIISLTLCTTKLHATHAGKEYVRRWGGEIDEIENHKNPNKICIDLHYFTQYSDSERDIESTLESFYTLFCVP